MAYEVKSTIHGTIEFSPINREFTVPLDVTAISEVRDIQLMVHSGPAVQPHPAIAEYSAGEDFRFFINNVDLTDQLIQKLQEELGSLDPEIVSKSYMEGVISYLALVQKFHMSPEILEKEITTAKKIAQEKRWVENISNLGDRNVGWSGNLHCFNYIYKNIAIKPISLKSVISLHPNSGTSILPDDLSQYENIRLIFSQGPLAISEEFDPEKNLPSGRVVYSIDVLSKNPLESKLREIASNLKATNKLLDAQRVNYLAPIKSSIEILLEDLKSGNSESIAALERLAEALKKI